MYPTRAASAREGCCCTLLLQGAAVRVACPLWSWPAGAAAGCCCRVLSEGVAHGMIGKPIFFGSGSFVA